MTGRQPLVLATVVIAVLHCANAAHKLPDDFPRCSVDDPKMEECLKSATIESIKKMKNGKKSLGMLPLDPMAVDEVVLDLGTNQAPFLFTARKISVYGLSDSIVNSVNFVPEKFLVDFTTLTPNATFTFDYDAKGRLLLLTVNGNGPGSFVFTDMLTNHRMEGGPFMKDGRTHWNITNYGIKFDAKKLDIHLEGLLKGNKQVSDQLSEFLHREWRLFLDQLRGPAGDAFGAIFKELANRIFSRVPYGDVFLGAQK